LICFIRGPFFIINPGACPWRPLPGALLGGLLGSSGGAPGCSPALRFTTTFYRFGNGRLPIEEPSSGVKGGPHIYIYIYTRIDPCIKIHDIRGLL